jgi:hypothetical protein
VIESLAISKLMSRKALPLSGSDLALAGTSYFPSARPSEIAADAGSAGVGHYGIESKRADRNHHGMRSRPDFERRPQTRLTLLRNSPNFKVKRGASACLRRRLSR